MSHRSPSGATAPEPSSAWTLTIPHPFEADIVQRSGPAGARWLNGLPAAVDRLLEIWQLEAEGPVMHGYLGMVLRVRHQGRPFALKLVEPTSEFLNQVSSLAAWRGRGMVALERHDPHEGAILMQWLDHSTSLDVVDLDDAIDAAGTVLRRLAVPADGAPGVRSLTDHVEGWPERWRHEQEHLGRPLPVAAIDAAAELCVALGTSAGSRLVDHDLHYRDILESDRGEWIAVDPKGVIGDPEFSLGPLMWNRFDGPPSIASRFARFVDRAELDHDRARGWLLVTVVDFFLWSTAAGLTRDPAACRAIADWLEGGTS